MKKSFRKPLALILSAAILASAAVFSSAAEKKSVKKKNYAEGEVIAVLKDNSPSRFQSSAKAASTYGNGIKLTGSYTFGSNKGNKLKLAALKSDSLSTEKLIREVEKNSAVKFAFPNYIKKVCSLTDDTYSDFQWGLKNTGQNNFKKGYDTAVESVWKSSDKPSDKENIVAVIDTGIDPEHEDLKDSLWTNPYGSKLVGKHGFDYSGTYDNGEPMDDNGHGSHVAGIIAARGDNKKGISGVNKSGVKLMALKFLDSNGSGFISDAFACFDYVSRAAKLGANITAVNCSWGGTGDEKELLVLDELFDEFGKLGIVTCCAAGNENADIDEQYDDWFSSGYFTPAASNSRYCLTVAAVDGNNKRISFSNFGKKVDVAAPGTAILSAVCQNNFNPTIYSDEQIKKLCSHINKYDDGVKDGDFGSPRRVEMSSNDEENSDSVDFTFKTTAKNFYGKSGKSVMLTPDEDSSGTVWVEFPYSIEDPTLPYKDSFIFRSEENASVEVYDVPASYTYDKIIDSAYDDVIIFADGMRVHGKSYGSFENTGGYWNHFILDCNNVDSEDGGDVDYGKVKRVRKENSRESEKQRKLVLAVNTNAAFYLDDLAVSDPYANEDDFGKYEFYNGTSMATPFVSGAVALLRNYYPESSTADIINMIKNTGMVSQYLDGLTENSRVIRLENLEALPPLITSFGYNEDGKLQIDGSFRDVTLSVDNKKTEPEFFDNSKLIISDNDFNTNEVDIKVKNKYGEDSMKKLVSNKKSYTAATEAIGTPEDTSRGITVNAGDIAFFIDNTNTAGVIGYNAATKSYEYRPGMFMIDFDKIERVEGGKAVIQSAVYYDEKIFFTAFFEFISELGGKVIGYDSMVGCYDIARDKLYDYGELDEENIFGASVAEFMGSIYVIGGHDIDCKAFSKDMFILKGGKLEKTDFKLPTARAYTKFIECRGKLVGVYGAQADEKIPQIIIFDGREWKNSSVTLKSGDEDTTALTVTSSKQTYFGNVGYDKDGVFCTGAYCFGLGDTFDYDPKTDTVKSSEYSFNNELHGSRLTGTTLPGAFVGFNIMEPVEEDEFYYWGKSDKLNSRNSFVANDVSDGEIQAFTIKLGNGTPKPWFELSPSEPEVTQPATQAPKADKVKKANTIKVTVRKKTVSASKLALKKQKVKPLTIKNAKGKVTCKIISAPKKLKKLLKISKKGVITINKGVVAKGNYRIKVKVTAKGNSDYKQKTVTKLVRIKIK